VKPSNLVLAGAVAIGGVVALVRPPPPPPVRSFDEGNVRQAGRESFDNERSEILPPDHPPVDGIATDQESFDDESDVPAALVWRAPVKWALVANPNKMRLATYRIPAASVADEAELSVVRAGGTTEANFARWTDQFADAEPAKRTHKKLRGLDVWTLEVGGTFLATGMGPSAGAQAPRPGWRLQGAVVETKGGSYFFKLVGPSASVRAARAEFDALLESIEPAGDAP